ncbi:MAG: antibiotic biosynthesis monooxygenase family protein [Aestuariibacter sp.]
MLAPKLCPPYYAVIFSSLKSEEQQGYSEMAEKMWHLASQQPGFLGAESASDDIGVTVSYWQSLEAIANWKQNSEHQLAQKMGRQQWYQTFRLRIAKVEREYAMETPD